MAAGEDVQHDSAADAHAEILILVFLVFSQYIFHRFRHKVEDDLTDEMKAILTAVVEEITGLGFVAMVGFGIISTGLLQYMSEKAFEGDGDHLVHMFEGLHFVLFSIMLGYLLSVVVCVYKYQKYTHHLNLTEVTVCCKGGLIMLLKGAQLVREGSSGEKTQNFDRKRYLRTLRYLKIRQRFIQSAAVDHTWVADELDQHFDFSEYLALNLASLIGSLIHLPMSSLSIVMVIFLLKYIFQLLHAGDISYCVFHLSGGPLLLSGCLLMKRNLDKTVASLSPVIPPLDVRSLSQTQKNSFPQYEGEIEQAKWFDGLIKEPPYLKKVDKTNSDQMSEAHARLFYRRNPKVYLTALRMLMLASSANLALGLLKSKVLWKIFPIIPFMCVLPHVFLLVHYPFRILDLLMLGSNMETSKNPSIVRKTIHIMKTKKIVRMLQLLDALAYVQTTVRRRRRLSCLQDDQADAIRQRFHDMSIDDDSDDEENATRTPRPRSAGSQKKVDNFAPRATSLLEPLASPQSTKLQPLVGVPVSPVSDEVVTFPGHEKQKRIASPGVETEEIPVADPEPESESDPAGNDKSATELLLKVKAEPPPVSPKNRVFSPTKVVPLSALATLGSRRGIASDRRSFEESTGSNGPTASHRQSRAALVRMGTLKTIDNADFPIDNDCWFEGCVTAGLEEVREKTFHAAFDLFDKDNSGTIEPEELYAVMNDLGFHFTLADIEIAFDHFDEDRDRTIGFTEFRDMLLCREKEVLETGVRASPAVAIHGLFKVFDVDGSGEVTIGEFHTLLQKLDENLQENEVLEFVRESDLNGDGVIDLFEFASMLRRYWVVDSKDNLKTAELAKFKNQMDYSGAHTGLEKRKDLQQANSNGSQPARAGYNNNNPGYVSNPPSTPPPSKKKEPQPRLVNHPSSATTMPRAKHLYHC